MSKIKLSTGDAYLRVWFSEEPTGRATNVVLTPYFTSHNHTGLHVIAKVVCFKGDTFSRKTGRFYAAKKLNNILREMPTTFTKEDRGIIFNAICPEFTKK